MSNPAAELRYRIEVWRGYAMRNDSDEMDNQTGTDTDADVDVLIVNYKTPLLTIEAAESVLPDPLVRHTIIVDNASGDGSAEKITKHFEPEACKVEVITSEQNVGFGGGNNLAAKSAVGRYLFLLNSDAVAQPGCIAKLRNTLQRDPQIGLVAPAVYLADTDELQPGTHGIFPTPAALLTRKTTISAPGDLRPDWISGVAFLARREEYEALGGFDESLFMYYEDVDFCRRYRQRGLAAAREPGATVVHKLGQSGIENSRRKAAYYQSQTRYLELSGYSRLTRLALSGARAIFSALTRNDK